MTECEHGLTVGGNPATECQECDWCPVCEAVRRYDGEVCTVCGYVWGEDQ